MLRGLELVAVLDHLSEGLIVATLDGALLHWNRAALATFDETDAAAVRVPLAMLGDRYRLTTIDGDELAVEQWPLARIARGEAIGELEVRVERRDRPWSRVFLFRGEIVRVAADGRDLALLHATDVTGRHQVEAALARERARQALLHTAARRLVGAAHLDSPEVEALHREVMAHLDADLMFHGRLRGDRLARVVAIGVPADQIDRLHERRLDETFSGEVAATGAALVLDADQLLRDPRAARTVELGGRAYAGYALRARDGRVLGTLSFVRSRRDSFDDEEARFLETYAHLVATAMERIDGEAALREREAQLHLLLAQAPVVMWSTDRDLKGTWAGGLALTRGRPGGGGSLSEVQTTPEHAVRGRDRHTRALAGEHVEYEEELNGVVLHALLVPLRDAAGAVIGTVGVAVDVTAAHAAERAIRKLNAELEDRVAARTAELRAANAELEAFAYAVAHDLRAPLRAVAGFTRAVLEDHGAILPPEGQDLLGDVIAASHTMSELIDGLLALSRLTRAELARDDLDLSAIARELLAELARAEPDRKVAVTVEPGLVARGDRRLIEAMLRNLLHNAWKYTGATAAPAITVRAETREGARGIAICDNGAGFAMAHAGKLFLPFQRLHRQDEFPGLGLGLATVLRIVRRHGGTIVGTGEPGAGACFWFTLALPTDREAS